MEENDEAVLLYFPPELVPAAKHPLVLQRGDEAVRHVLMQRLHLYLDFTAELEQWAVNPVCALIARRRSGLDLPEAMLADAYKIYTDEAWHAHFSDDMQRQIEVTSGVGALRPSVHSFRRRLEAGGAHIPAMSAGVAQLFFTIVSETLISGVLAAIPNDYRIVPAVREIIADHAVDEGVHHAYFANLLEFAWPQLPKCDRAAVALALPHFIRAFLDPDLAALAAILHDTGLASDEVGQVISDAHPPANTAATVRAGAQMTMRHLRRVGVLDLAPAREAFAAEGLV
jgi:hypothetical protein